MSEFKDLKAKYPQAFPLLNEKQIKIVEEFAECKTYEDGEYLFRAGETEFMFHVLKSGEIEILDRSGGEEKILVIHDRSGEFTGDVANLTGSPANADARAKGKTKVYEICSPALLKIIAERPSLSDTILQTFITRVQILQEIDLTGLRVIGSQYSKDTFRIRDFLSKNQVIFTWINIENDPQVGELLKSFKVKPEETPIVAYAEDWFLKNPSNEELAEKLSIKHELDNRKQYDLAIVGGEQVVVVGGGNSAGQAAIFLSEKARKVFLLIRGNDLNAGMSRYLSKRIEDTANIEIRTNTEITKIFGDTHVEKIEIINNQTEETEEHNVAGIFSFIGARPRTEWLPTEIETDKNGFVVTGTNIHPANWNLKRPPFFLETSCPGVFAAGDVRCDSVKRVASAVGEGSMTVQSVHEYLKDF